MATGPRRPRGAVLPGGGKQPVYPARGGGNSAFASVPKGMRRLGALLLLAAMAQGVDRIEKRDDGKRTGKQSVAVSGHAISYDAPADRPFVRSVLVHGARYGEGYDPTRTSFEVALCDEKFTVLAKVAASYCQFSPYIFTWAEVPLPEPVRVPRTFKVVVDFGATSTKGVYVGYADVAKSHSSYFRTGGGEQEFAKGKEWMIRVRMSESQKPLAHAARDMREALRAAQVPRLEAADLAATLARLSDAAHVPIVLDGPAAAAPEIPAGSAAEALDRIAAACALAWDTRWGVVYVATRVRLNAIPGAVPEPADDARTPATSIALRTELARRRVDLECHGLPLDQAVAQVSGWLEFRVRWDPHIDRRQRVTVVGESLVARDALSLLLLPRDCTYQIVERTIEITPVTR